MESIREAHREIKLKNHLKDLLYNNCELSQNMSNDVASDVIWRWRESHRYFHTLEHLKYIVNEIKEFEKTEILTEDEVTILYLTAYFHDVIYDPRNYENEKASATYFNESVRFLSTDITNAVNLLILESDIHVKATSELSRLFRKFDTGSIYKASLTELIRYEHQIFKEYQYVSYSNYREGRIKVLEHLIELRPNDNHNIQQLIEYVKSRKVNIGIYPGSFNPFHKGHLAILEKAEEIFDKVIIAVGHNPNKDDNRDSAFKSLINSKKLRYHEIVEIKGLLTDYMKEIDSIYANYTVVKGLRNGADLDYEVNQLRFMTDMMPNYKIVYLPCDKQYEHVSSSAIRQLMKLDPEVAMSYLP